LAKTKKIMEQKVEPVVHTPVADQVVVPAESPKKNRLLVILLVVVLLVLGGGTASAYLIATEKIPVSNPKIRHVVNMIPFLPKSPRFVLESMVQANQKIAKESFDVSMSMNNPAFVTMLGTQSLDMQIKGYADISDEKNPMFSANIALTKEFNMDLLKNDEKMLYFRINQLPSILSAYLGNKKTVLDQIKGSWVAYDSSALDTPAHKEAETRNLDSGEIDPELKDIFDKDILPNVVMTSETKDGESMYKFTYAPTPSQLDDLFEKLNKQIEKSYPEGKSVLGASTLEYKQTKASEFIKEPKMEMWVDKSNYYLRQMNIGFNIETKSNDPAAQGYLSQFGNKPIATVMVIKYFDFGKSMPLDTPAKFMTMEQFYALIIGPGGLLEGMYGR